MVLLLAGTRWLTPSRLGGPVGDPWMGRTPAWYVASGIFDTEIDQGADHPFSWTGQTAGLLFPRLERSQPYHLTLRVSAGRPAAGPPPPLSLLVDGVPAGQVESSTAPQLVAIEIPPRAVEGASVTLVASNTFVPGSGDSRALGAVASRSRVGAAIAAGGVLAVAWSGVRPFPAIIRGWTAPENPRRRPPNWMTPPPGSR